MPSNTPSGQPLSSPTDQAYASVPCVFHERLEFAVLRGLELDLTWSDAAGTQRDRVRPCDVHTRDGAEWLVFRRGDGAEAVVRLDRIQAMQEYFRPAP
ncbi:MAG: transcriptional antiterminator, Rof [Thiobacillaceae bacterium]|nr:transcriptional antiterminator, Rof [Thiobacillaceae bacterium]